MPESSIENRAKIIYTRIGRLDLSEYMIEQVLTEAAKLDEEIKVELDRLITERMYPNA